MTDRQAVFSERDLTAQVASVFPAGASAAQLHPSRQILEAAVFSGEAIPLPNLRAGNRRSLADETSFATRSQLANEQRVLTSVHQWSR